MKDEAEGQDQLDAREEGRKRDDEAEEESSSSRKRVHRSPALRRSATPFSLYTSSFPIQITFYFSPAPF